MAAPTRKTTMVMKTEPNRMYAKAEAIAEINKPPIRLVESFISCLDYMGSKGTSSTTIELNLIFQPVDMTFPGADITAG